MSRIHISDDGEPRPCSASSPATCRAKGPNGEKSEHFDNYEEARVRSEHLKEEMYGKFNTLAKAAPLNQNELNKIAKESNDTELLDLAIKNGKKRVYNSLIENPNLTPDQVGKIIDSAGEGYFREYDYEKMSRKSNFPIDRLTDEQLYSASDDHIASQVESRDDVDDEFAKKVMGYSFEKYARNVKKKTAVALLSNHNNKLSSDMVNTLASFVLKSNLEVCKNNPKFDMKDAFSRMSDSEKRELINYRIKSPELIKEVYAVSKNDSELLSAFAYNKNTPTEVLDDIIKNSDLSKDDGAIGYAVYTNPNCSEKTKNYIAKRSNLTKSMIKLDKLEEDGKLNDLFDTSSSATKVRSFGRVYRFDPEKVKAAGLNADDIDNLIRIKKNDYLFGARYNEETGIYNGYID